MILDGLLWLHVAAGAVALPAGLTAALIKILDGPHRWHVLSGKAFFWGMAVIFLTAVPISILRGNVFLLLIAVFSFYLALSGWRYARNRSGATQGQDWVRSGSMLAASVVMAGYGLYLLRAQDTNGYTMLVFAVIGAALSMSDIRIMRSGGVTGANRIASHLTMMLAASIATITAFLVVNVAFEPAYVVWLAPTVVITPLIVILNFRIRKQAGGK